VGVRVRVRCGGYVWGEGKGKVWFSIVESG
jgi:hypothetical protein